MSETRITFRVTTEDQIAIDTIREHLRPGRPWANRTDTIRFALHQAADDFTGADSDRKPL